MKLLSCIRNVVFCSSLGVTVPTFQMTQLRLRKSQWLPRGYLLIGAESGFEPWWTSPKSVCLSIQSLFHQMLSHPGPPALSGLKYWRFSPIFQRRLRPEKFYKKHHIHGHSPSFVSLSDRKQRCNSALTGTVLRNMLLLELWNGFPNQIPTYLSRGHLPLLIPDSQGRTYMTALIFERVKVYEGRGLSHFPIA